jgi:hypothetical protein
MPIPNTTSGTIRGELLGLKTHLTLATTNVVSKTTGNPIRNPNVRNRDYTGTYDGPWPLVLVRYELYRINLIAGGKPPVVGQTLPKANIYSIQVMDVVVPGSSPASEAVAASQDDCIDLCDAIVAWFNYLPNRCLPVTINNVVTPMASYAGVPLEFHGMPPFREEESGEERILFEGAIAVQGIAQTGTT